MIPALGGCGAVASIRIEGYSPRDGMAHGQLDVSADFCDEHAQPAAEALLAAGYTTHQMLTGGPEYRCGTGFDYTALVPIRPKGGAR